MQRKEVGILHSHCSWVHKDLYKEADSLYLHCFQGTRIAHARVMLGCITAGFVGRIDLPKVLYVSVSYRLLLLVAHAA